MFVVESYPAAVVFCVITMLCWGSWANMQKAVGKRWRFELFYWDYTFGVLLASLGFAFTMGSIGTGGRSFLTDLTQADWGNLGWAMLGGAIFNAANLLLVAAIDLAGMAVAFPVGIGIALVLGVLVNYLTEPVGNPVVLFLGVAFVVAAVLLDALAYRKIPNQGGKGSRKGLVLAVLCGVLMGYFYRFVAMAMSSPDQLVQMPAGKLSPYTAVVFLALGILLSNFVLNTAIMLRPFSGSPIPFTDYFRGTMLDHVCGLLGGIIWTVGMVLSIVAAEKAGYAISYGLGAQGGTMVAGFWGVFVWREFRAAPRGISWLLGPMFASYFVGLILVVVAKVV